MGFRVFGTAIWIPISLWARAGLGGDGARGLEAWRWPLFEVPVFRSVLHSRFTLPHLLANNSRLEFCQPRANFLEHFFFENCILLFQRRRCKQNNTTMQTDKCTYFYKCSYARLNVINSQIQKIQKTHAYDRIIQHRNIEKLSKHSQRTSLPPRTP